MLDKYRKLSLRTKVVLSMTAVILVYGIIFVVITVSNMKKEFFAQAEITNMESVN